MALITSILTGGVNNHPTTSEEANFIGTDFFTEGVVGTITNTSSVAPMTGAFAVNAQGTPDMTVAVTAGAAYVTATPSGQNSQNLRVRLTANENVNISSNSSGSTKYDWLYLKVDPTNANAPNLAGDNVATLVTSRSSSNSTDDGTPPTYGTLLAVITVANGAVSITNAVIRDARTTSSLNIVSATNGWQTGLLPAVSSVTHNGNRSSDMAFASSVASTLSPGMRLEITKTVAGNGYMGGAFNGSSHYFTKTTPSGTLGTVTNTFTIEATAMPTSYQLGRICGRSDATPSNGFALMQEADGRVTCIIYNAGAANYRSGTTYQSLPLNKKTTIAVTYSSAVTGIYFDGVSVPFSVTSGGSNPTVAGTGGDWSIGRMGAYAAQYFPGYISNVAVFNAVLSAATIKQHATYKLLGNETNCIGAWSLDNTANDQSSAGNNLTATGGVGYTAISPHGQLGNGVETSKAIALVMAVSGSTATVQTPEGVTIPTSGGISSVAYATNGNPFGWVSDKNRWQLTALMRFLNGKSSPTADVWYNDFAPQLYLGAGAWEVGYLAALYGNRLSGDNSVYATLSTANNSETDVTMTSGGSANPSTDTSCTTAATRNVSVSSGQTYYLNYRTKSAGLVVIYLLGDRSTVQAYATPSGL